MIRKLILFTIMAAAVALSGCSAIPNLLGEEATPVPFTPTPTTPPTAAITLAPTLGGFDSLAPPTLTPSPTGQGGPTPLPAPTQIGAATVAPSVAVTGTHGTPVATGTAPTSTEAAPVVNRGSGSGIVMDPQLGEPGDVVMVYGDGFAPNEKVDLHWGPTTGATGPVYWTEQADANGSFEVGLIVLPADRWPGSSAKEGDELQLRATAPSLGFNYFWANFKYVRRFDPGTSLVQTFENPDWDYSISLPNGWRWSWVEDHTENVRILNPSQVERGFIRVIETTNVQSAIAAVMSAEGLTASSSRTATLGNFPNSTEVTTTSGRVVWFISGRSRVYAISIVDDSGKFYTIIGNSFGIL